MYGPVDHFFETFYEDIDKARNRAHPLTELKWSNALALSAARFV